MMETIPCRPTNASSYGSSWAADGFTLIEVVVALLILAVGILGAASMQITAIKGNGTAYKITEASMVASERAEKLLALDFGSADLADGSEKVNGFGVEWVVVSPTTDPDRRDITVTVAWKEGDRAHSFDYRFLKARGI